MDEKAPNWPTLDPENVSKFLEESDWNLKMEVYFKFFKMIAQFPKIGSYNWGISRVH